MTWFIISPNFASFLFIVFFRLKPYYFCDILISFTYTILIPQWSRILHKVAFVFSSLQDFTEFLTFLNFRNKTQNATFLRILPHYVTFACPRFSFSEILCLNQLIQNMSLDLQFFCAKQWNIVLLSNHNVVFWVNWGE